MMDIEAYRARNTGSPGGGAAVRTAAPLLRTDAYTVSLASDIGALGACLALERACAEGPAPGSDGIQSPTAVPFCEFLTVRSRRGRLEAVCRLMRLDRDNPLGQTLKAGRLRLSPLITAIRYTRKGILEMGAPVFAPGCNPDRLAGILWTGVVRHMERNGLGFVVGQEVLAHNPGDAKDWARLMDAHGLHPDLEVETRSVFRSGPAGSRSLPSPAAPQDPARNWPVGLREALRRGCRLACEPELNPVSGSHEFVWVASREMLEDGGSDDWRGAC
jgi:hypothetical protein